MVATNARLYRNDVGTEGITFWPDLGEHKVIGRDVQNTNSPFGDNIQDDAVLASTRANSMTNPAIKEKHLSSSTKTLG